MSWELYRYILARQTATHFYSLQGKMKTLLNEFLAFSREYPCNFRNGIPIDFLEKLNQSLIKTYSGHFHLSCISGLILLSLRISCLIPGLFKYMSPLGQADLLPAGWHAGTSQASQEWGPTEEHLSFQHRIWRSYK